MVRAAWVRLYAELNDFVAGRSGVTEHLVEVGAGRSVKDAIESLGVPHTEVELILVDGEPAGFGHRLAPGERVSAFPHFTSLAPVQGVAASPAPAPDEDVRFVADGHVAALARHLRLLGFDTLCDQGWDDERLAAVSAGDDRVLLTRDRGLLRRRVVERGMFVRDDDPDDQLLDVVRRMDLADRIRPFSRCTACNGVLVDVEKAEVEEALAPGTRRHVDRFRRCPDCGRVYWRGAHHPRLAALVDRAVRAGGREGEGGG